MNVSGADPLGDLLASAAAGRFPAVDGGVTILHPAVARLECVIAFTGHSVVSTSLPPDAVLAEGPDGFGGAVAPRFLLWLAGDGGTVGSHDVLLVARGTGQEPPPRRHDLDDHPRVRHARTLRADVLVHGDEDGLVTVGIGLGGHQEVSVEVTPERRGRGAGRRLATAARALVPPDGLVIAEVTPGNAQSLRAFLAAGFRPLGSAVLITPGDRLRARQLGGPIGPRS